MASCSAVLNTVEQERWRRSMLFMTETRYPHIVADGLPLGETGRHLITWHTGPHDLTRRDLLYGSNGFDP